jgi:hypothetical protein
MKDQFIAHLRKKDGKQQQLWEHLEEVSEIAGRFDALAGQFF